MRRPLALLLLVGALAAGEASRSEREARALSAVQALPEGERRETGLRVLRQAWSIFRADAQAAAGAIPADADEARRARLAELAERNASLAGLEERPMAALRGHLARWPLDDAARAMLGRRLLAAGDRDGAMDQVLAVLALDPASAEGRELRGLLTLASRDADTAAAAVADLAPLCGRLLAEGCAAEAAGDGAAAQRALDRLETIVAAVAAPADRARLTALRAGAAERGGAADKALALWREAAAGGVTAPDPAPRIRALVRRLHADRVAPAIAAGDLAALRELSPAFAGDDALQDRMFRILLGRGQLGETRRAALDLLAADPAHPLALLMAEGAAAALGADRLERLPPFLVRLHIEAATLGARFAVVHGLVAALTEAAGDPAGAARALDPLLERLPGDRGARWQRSRLRLAAGDRDGALADAEALLTETPDDSDSIGLRARIRAAAGDRAGALADADRVVALRPGTAALGARAQIRAQLGDRPGLAADLAAMASAARDAGDVPALLDAADLAQAQGDPAAQRLLLETAARLGSADATLRLRRLR